MAIMIEFNNGVLNYGCSPIIKKYTNFPHWLPLPISYQHGWRRYPTSHDASSTANECWLWDDSMLMKYKNIYPNIKFRAVGAPFLYLLDNLNYKPKKTSQRNGSVVFLSHSCGILKSVTDSFKYAEELDNLPLEFKPITLVVYYLDLSEKLIQPYLDKGFDVVSNGPDILDPDFMIRMIWNIDDKKYLLANDRTTALLYGTIMGLDCFAFGVKPVFQAYDFTPKSELLEVNDLNSGADDWDKIFSFNESFESRLKYSMEVLGCKNKLKNFEMRSVLIFNIYSFKYWLNLIIYTSKSFIKKLIFLLRKLRLN